MNTEEFQALLNGTDPNTPNLAWHKIKASKQFYIQALLDTWMEKGAKDMLIFFIEHSGCALHDDFLKDLRRNSARNIELLKVVAAAVECNLKDMRNGELVLPILQVFVMNVIHGKGGHEGMKTMFSSASIMPVIGNQRRYLFNDMRDNDFAVEIFRQAMEDELSHTKNQTYLDALSQFPKDIQQEIITQLTLHYTNPQDVDTVFFSPHATPFMQECVLDTLDDNSYTADRHQDANSLAYQMMQAREQRRYMKDAVDEVDVQRVNKPSKM